MIDTIIFDVGRVLVDFNWETRFQQLNYDTDLQNRLINCMFSSDIWNEFDRSVVADEKLLEQFIAIDPACANEITEIFTHVDLMIRQYPYTLEWIKHLKEEEYKIFILSNYSRSTYRKTQTALNFLSLVDGALFSFECGYIKPEPEIYQLLFERFAIDPQCAVFIDDRPMNLDGAAAFGVTPLLFTTFEETSDRLKQLLSKKNPLH